MTNQIKPNELLTSLEIAKHQLLTSAAEMLTSDELEAIKPAIDAMSEEEFRKYIENWFGSLYKHTPVDVRHWVESSEYMGLKGQLFPTLLDDFEELFTGDYDEGLLHGSIGWGKSFFSSLALTRMIYEVSCLENPQQMFGLAEGSPIVFLNIATSLPTAKEIVFGNVKNFVNNSRYFKNYYPVDRNLNDALYFPNNIRVQPVASGQGGILGQNMYGGVLDEANFMHKTTRSVRSRSVNEEYNHAKILWNAMIRRMKSRFNQFGKLPGILLTVSSSMYPDDFTEWRAKQAISNNEKVFIRRYSHWTPRPKSLYLGPQFKVALGNSTIRPSIILNPDEKGYDIEKPEINDLNYLSENNVKVIDVPIEYRSDFESDIDMAIRDFAGYPTLASYPFFKNTEIIENAITRGKEAGLEHGWTAQTITFDDGQGWAKSFLDDYVDLDDVQSKKAYERDKPHFVHIDLAIKNDACGIAVIRLDEVIEQNHTVLIEDRYSNTVNETETSELVPKMSSVLLLRVKAPQGGEIDIQQVRMIIMQLYKWSFRLEKVTYDQFNSAESIQQFTQAGINSGLLSVDRTLDPYNTLKESFIDNRLNIYKHDIMVQELVRLERDLVKNKVDHPAQFSKDVADALTGAVYSCTTWVRENPGSISLGNMTEYDNSPAGLITTSNYGSDVLSLDSWFNSME